MTLTETVEAAARKGGRRRAKDAPGAAKADKSPQSSKAAYVAPMPRTNLLPEKYLKAAAKKARFTQLGAAVAAAVLSLVALFLAQTGEIAAATSGLHDAQSALTSVTMKATDPKLLAASSYFSAVDTMLGTAKTAMSNEILYSNLLGALSNATPSGVQFGSVSFSAAASGAAPAAPTTSTSTPTSCPGPDPFNTVPSIGCVTFTGTARNATEVNALLDHLSTDKTNFVNPFITSTGAGGASSPTPGAAPAQPGANSAPAGGVSFSGSVSLRPTVLSGRYLTGVIFGDTSAVSKKPGAPAATTPNTPAATGGTPGNKNTPALGAAARSGSPLVTQDAGMFSLMNIAMVVLLFAALGALIVLRKKQGEKKK